MKKELETAGPRTKLWGLRFHAWLHTPNKPRCPCKPLKMAARAHGPFAHQTLPKARLKGGDRGILAAGVHLAGA